MKKIISAAAFALLAFFLVSCGKKIDSSTWIDSISYAQKVAREQKKNMIVFVSALDSNPMSKAIYDNVFSKEEFIKKYAENFVLAHLDFSDSLYAASEVDEKASKSKKKAAEELKAKLDENFKLVQFYNVPEPLALLIFSKDGYFIKELDVADEQSMQDIDDYLEASKEEFVKFDELVEKAKSGTKEEKIDAINTLFNITSYDRNYALCHFAEDFIKLDPENSSGKVFEYLQCIAYKNSFDRLYEGDVVGAGEEFAKIAENPVLKPREKQDAYFSAAYYLASANYNDYALIKDYLERAYTADSNSELAPTILSAINQVEMAIAGYSDNAASEGNASSGLGE